MEKGFAKPELRDICENFRAATKTLGAESARKLRSRLADIDAAESVSELVAGKPHPLKGTRAGQLSISLAGGMRLVIEPANDPIPKKNDGSVDWAQVTKVRVIEIEDYHD